MGTRFWATGVAIGLLLGLMAGSARADTWRATGQTDLGYCATAGVAWCSDISYSLDFTTGPPVLDTTQSIQNVFLFITAVSGQINGAAVSCTSATLPTLPSLCGDMIASRVNYSGPPVPDDSIGLIGNGGVLASLFSHPDATLPVPIVRVSIGNSRAFTDWSIVSTPEPSTLVLLGITFLGLMGLSLLKDRLI